MTDQPMENQQEQPVPVQQLPEKLQNRPKGMRFFASLDDRPSAPTYMQPLGLARFEETADTVIMERFDQKGRKWVDFPAMIEFIGMGGDSSYQEIDEEKANQLIAMWTPDDAEAEEADAEPVPEDGEAEAAPVDNEPPVPLDERDVPEWDSNFRSQEGEDHSEEVFGFLEGRIEVSQDESAEEEPDENESEKTVAERLEQDQEDEEEEEEPEERSFSLVGLLRRIFNV